MLNIDPLLSEVSFDISVLREAKKRFEDQLAPDFSLFDHLRTDELFLSCCLVDLLNPKGKHGQGRFFLDSFLE